MTLFYSDAMPRLTLDWVICTGAALWQQKWPGKADAV